MRSCKVEILINPFLKVTGNARGMILAELAEYACVTSSVRRHVCVCVCMAGMSIGWWKRLCEQEQVQQP